MDIEALTRLNLKKAFEGNIKFDTIVCDNDYFTELFDYSSRALLFVYDNSDKGFSVFVSDTNGLGRDKTFIVKNPNRKDVFLMHIDGVLFKKDSKCDCALLTDSAFLFIEFKSEAANRIKDGREECYKKSYSQLLATVQEFILRFQSIGVKFLSQFTDVGAFAVFNPTVPKTLSTEQILSTRFLRLTGMKLHFNNFTLMK